MKRIIPLNTEQQNMVESNLQLVKRAIYKYIIVNDTILGLDFDDLFQEGCIWLCKAAATFREDKGAKFETYAEKVVVNGLRTYYRLTYNKQKRILSLSDCKDYELSEQTFSYPLDDKLIEHDILSFLHSLKSEYSGVARLGIEAIGWKVKGLTGAEIARMYNVKPNVVGAWISRAVQKLKKNVVFTIWMEQFGKQNASYEANVK